MNTLDFVRLTTSLSRRREADPELWVLLSKVLVTLMNTKKLRNSDLMTISRSFVNAQVRSDKLYSFIVRYFCAVGFPESQWSDAPLNSIVLFYYSLARAYA